MPNDSLKILIVDQDASVALALERGLSPHRATIEIDAKAAYRRLVAGEWFDAVVCDASMHEMTGHELLAAVREHGFATIRSRTGEVFRILPDPGKLAGPQPDFAGRMRLHRERMAALGFADATVFGWGVISKAISGEP